MGNITTRIKKFMLRRQIRNCKLKMIDLKARRDEIHQIILDEIEKGEDKVKTAKLNLERNELLDRHLELIDLQYKLESRLKEA